MPPNQTSQPIKITLLKFDKTVSLDTRGLIYKDVYNPQFDDYDAIANINVDLNTFKNMFCFQTDYIDVDNVHETDIKYYVLIDKIPYFIPNLGSSIVGTNPIVSLNPNGTIGLDQFIGKDFTRYLATLLFNTPYGTDLFVNETELVNSVSSALLNAWGYCANDLESVSNEGNNPNIPLVGNSPAKYLTNDFSAVTNICRELFLQVISKAPERFTNLPQIPVDDVSAAPIREGANYKYYYLPFIQNDCVQLRVKLYPSVNQPTFGLPTTDTNKFETVGNNTHLKGRTYLINMKLTDSSTGLGPTGSTGTSGSGPTGSSGSSGSGPSGSSGSSGSGPTGSTGSSGSGPTGSTGTSGSGPTGPALPPNTFSMMLVGNSALSPADVLNNLPIEQSGNILTITPNATQINATTVKVDIEYTISPTATSSELLDVGVRFSNVKTWYNTNIASIDIEKFEGIPLYGRGDQFKGLWCAITFSATDSPSITPGTSFMSAFEGMSNFNENVNFLNNWDTFNVSDMSYMFYNCANFNQNMNDFDVSGVTTMSHMFDGCSVFNNENYPFFRLNTSSALLDMSYMFANCDNFNQTINEFDVSGVTTMSHMFDGCSIFNNENTDLTLNTSSALLDVSYMFSNCANFNKRGDFDVSGVTTMSHMFDGCSVFNNGSLMLNLNTSSALLDMSYMFYNCANFNQRWNFDMSGVTTMSHMFDGCSMFNNGNTNLTLNTSSALLDVSYMFYNCANFNQLINFDMSGVTTMSHMFDGCSEFNNDNYPFFSLNTSSALLDMSYMFANCDNLNQTIYAFDVSGVTTMSHMFYGCSVFNNADSPLYLNTSSALLDVSYMFYNCISLHIPVNIYLGGVTNDENMYG
jgi:hypothetical protein